MAPEVEEVVVTVGFIPECVVGGGVIANLACEGGEGVGEGEGDVEEGKESAAIPSLNRCCWCGDFPEWWW